MADVIYLGATKLYFILYSSLVIILFNTGLHKTAFPTDSFGKIALVILPLSFCHPVILFSAYSVLHLM